MERSYGIIPLKKSKASWQLLMVKHQAGHWAFPKGHPDPPESPIETAERELKEETHLEVAEMLQVAPLQESYRFEREGKKIEKSVTYYLALVQGEVHLQSAELSEGRWVDLLEATQLATFPECKKLCSEISKILKR